MEATRTFDRVYVWEWPVRIYHWVNATAIVVLIATGFLIAWPPAILSSAEASARFWFGWTRLIHFVSAFVFVFALTLRLYWSLVGNQYARWWNFLPVTPPLMTRQARQVLQVLKIDILRMGSGPLESIGHNALAAWSYTALFVLAIFQIATGFALYAPMSDFWLPHAFAWVTALMGGDASVRLWHHAATWLFIVFTLIHIYLSVFHDVVEGRGEISSMVSGVKFVARR